jgi:phage-related baseplate assembly protein
MTTAVDLSLLPAPDVVESLSYQVILDAMLADLRSRDAQYTAIVESDPAYKILEVAAYRELLIRQRVNDAARATMLAYAIGSDLDQIGARYDVVRQLISPGDPDAVPPVPPVYESDTRYRSRIQLSLERYSTAGPIGAYVYHALSASPAVKDVSVVSPTPGVVVLTVLSTEGDGVPDPSLVQAVYNTLSSETVRPLTDMVTVQPATVVEYTIDATLYYYQGPDTQAIGQLARNRVSEYANTQHRLGYDVTLSGLYQALHVPGLVQRVVLHSPSQDVVVDKSQAAYATTIIIQSGGYDE